MADYRQVHTKIWDDDWFIEISQEEKIFFFWLMTNRRASVSGLYEFSCGAAARETGLPKKDIEKMVVRFQEAQKILVEDGWIWVINLRKYNDSKSPNSQKRIEGDLAQVPEHMRTEYLAYYQDLASTYQGATKGLDSTFGNKNKNKNIEKEKESEQENESVPSAAHANALVTAFKNVTGRFPPKNTWSTLTEKLGQFDDEEIDETLLSIVYDSWVAHGYNKMNYMGILDWYISQSFSKQEAQKSRYTEVSA